jgi:hypothetical protein
MPVGFVRGPHPHFGGGIAHIFQPRKSQPAIEILPAVATPEELAAYRAEAGAEEPR